MKKIFTTILTKLAMIAVLATAFAGSAWAETVTWPGTTTLPGTATAIGNSPIKIKTSSTNTYSNPIRIYANTKVTITADEGYTIQSVTYEASSTGSYVTNAQNATVSPDVTPTVSGKNVTWTLNNATTFTFTPSSQTRASSISVTYASSGSSNLQDSNLAITGAPVALTFDLYNNKTAQTVSYTTSGTGAVTVSGGTGYISTSVNSGNKTISVTPVAVTPSAQTITINQAADDTYAAGSATFTVSIADSTPYTQPTEITITPNYTFWGESAQFSGDAKDNLSGSKDNVSLEWSKGSGSTYANTTAMRFYKDNTLTFTAPTGYEIKSIDLTVSGTYSDLAFSPSGWDNENTKWTGSSETVTMSRPSNASSYATISSITITLGQPSSVTAPTFSPAGGTSFGNEGLNVTISATNGTIHYTLDGSNPTTSSSVYSSAIHITATTTIKAIAADGTDISSVVSATYTYLDPNRPGTQNNPYTVSQARAAIDAGSEVDGVYATGIVSEIVTAYNSQYGNISYNISVDGSTSADQLQAYRGKSYNGNDFTSADDIKVGDVVVVYGNLTKFGSTYEFAADNQLVSLDRPVHPIIIASNVTIEHDATSGEIAYTVDNPSTGVTLGATTTADWISDIVVTAEKVTFTTTANEGDADRTATFTLTYTGADNKTVTVTQKHFVADYATLPFEYDGNGAGNLPAGFTCEGLSTYSSSPKMQFNGTGDYAILQINERPGILTFDIKGNSFSGGTFKVQTSVDGTTYTDLETYTELGTTQSESFDNLGENVRYIKWIYTNKSSGNVALGNIKLEVYVPIVKHTVSWTAGANTELFVFAGDQSTTINSGAEVAEGTTVWISIDVASGYVFDALTVKDANNSDVTLTEETPGSFYSFTMPTSNVTITSSAVAEPPVPVSDWVLTDIGDLTADDVFIIVGDNGDTFALSNNNGTTNPPAAVAVSVSGNKWTGAVADNLKWNISGNATDGYTFYPNGSTTTWLYCTNSNNGVRVGDSANNLFVISEEGYLQNSANSRYVGIYDSSDWRCYTSINDNIKDQSFSFYKLDVPVAQNEIIIPAAKNNGQYWASFYCSLAGYTISEGAKAFTMNASKQLYLLGDGNVIPANTAVIIISDTDTITLTKTDNASATVSGVANILVGSDSDTAASDITGTPYVLSIVNNALGFYKFTGTIPANKAYYIVNE